MTSTSKKRFPKLTFQYVQGEIPETLLEFLIRRFKYHDALTWEERISSGYVKVNGKKCSPNHLLETRHRIVYYPPPEPEPPVDDRHEILYEDQELLAVNKSGNIPTSPSGKYWHNCLVHRLMEIHDLPELHAVHRLDRETSGINLFAKSKESSGILGKVFSSGQVRKYYMAILRGHLASPEILVRAPLRNAEGAAVRIRQEAHPDGRAAVTRFILRALLPGASLAEIRPLTGRTHQIRAHAEYMGHPVRDDKLYGRPESEFIAWIENGERSYRQRHFLHATKLVFPHPSNGKEICVESSAKILLDLFHSKRHGEGGGELRKQ